MSACHVSHTTHNPLFHNNGKMKKVYGSVDTTLKSSPVSSLEDLLGAEADDVIHETKNLVSMFPRPDGKLFLYENAYDNAQHCHHLEYYRWAMYFTAFLFGTVFALSTLGLLPTQGELEHFEYIIVGAGPAGLVAGVNLAKKLQQEAEKINAVPGKVLILESGTESQSDVLKGLNRLSGTSQRQSLRPVVAIAKPDAWSLPDLNSFDIPLMWSSLSLKTDASEFLSHHWPVSQSFLGRAVGGSGLHNAMINVRALPNDFDKWNVTNWSSDELLPYYSMLEDYDATIPTPNVWSSLPSSANRGKGGPLKITIGGVVVSPIANAFISSAVAAGLPLASPGFNDADAAKRLGVGYYEFNIRDGVRDSVAKAMLSPDVGSVPSNLVLKTDATVKEVLFETMARKSSIPKAVGVRYYSSETQSFQDVHLESSKSIGKQHKREPEVILSAGAILSSQILANSGISKDGKRVNSPEVGENVQDHPVVAVVYQASEHFSRSIVSYFNTDGDQSSSFENYLNVEESAHRPLMNLKNITMSPASLVYGTAGISVGGFLASPWSTDNVPDIQLTVFPHTKEPHFVHRKRSGETSSTNSSSNSNTERRISVLVTVALLTPESRNKINLNKPENDIPKRNEESSRTKFESYYKFHVPDIEGGTLTELDTKIIAWGVDQVRNIMSVPPLSDDTIMEQYPGVQYQDTELEQFIQKNAMRNSHWSGSTRMGDDQESVVDAKLRVNGVENLRVVDAGVMPYIPNGNTHSTTCVIALRAVDLIFTET